MLHNKIVCILIIVFVELCSYQCIKVIPERAQLVGYDKEYFRDISLNVRRSRRGGDYVVNANFTALQYFGNNFTVSILFYEYLHNEYKLTFAQMHFKLCDLILKERIFGEVVRNVGLVNCPMAPGRYIWKNLGFNHELPSVWPFEKGMLQMVFKHDAKPKSYVVTCNVMITLINNVPAKGKQTKAG